MAGVGGILERVVEGVNDKKYLYTGMKTSREEYCYI